MVFLAGPRQCGKTTLAKALLAQTTGRYLNWDADTNRIDILKQHWSDDDKLLVFDELHKYPRWKNWIKGVYDTNDAKHSILVTGSARLDVYRRGGDSLLGRYHQWHLHPFSLSELPTGISKSTAFERLLTIGGFPEPFLDGSEREAKRWRKERLDRVLRDDIRDLEGLNDVTTMELLVQLLRTRVGSNIVVSNLAQDLGKSPKTILKWIEALERMFLIFRVKTFTHNLPRAIRKPFKVYFYDTGDVIGDEGARFENFVATHLLKHLHFREDYEGDRLELCVIQDKESREVDFAVIDRATAKPRVLDLIEAKWSDTEFSPHLRYYAERLSPQRAIQVVGQPANTRRLLKKGALESVAALDYFSVGPWQHRLKSVDPR